MKNSGDWRSLQIAARQELARRNPGSLLDWTLAYRFIRGEPMRLPPALHEIYRDDHTFVVIQKAAQVFITEYLINVGLWVCETCQGDRGNALYVMPTQAQMDDFSQARIDKAISESPYLQSRVFPPPPGRPGAARLRLKKVGLGHFYLRGSESRRALTSVDADVVILDEYDQMEEGVVELAQKRLASSRLGWLRVASTPTLPEASINSLFLHSDQRYYLLKCPGCGRDQRLTWEENVDQRNGLVVCRRRKCRKEMDLWAPGRWEAAAPGNDQIHGYHINRLYSPLANIHQMIYESQATTPAARQLFANAVLGNTFVPEGGQLTLDVLDRCRREYVMGDIAGTNALMGVDVGIKLHVVIRQPLEDGRARALFIGEVDTFEELGELMTRHNVRHCVVDALPDLHKAREFTRGRRGVWLAYYDRQDSDHDWVRAKGTDLATVHINRVQALDEVFDRFHKGKAELPSDARHLGGRVERGFGEYYREMMALKRSLEQNAQGNWVARYVTERRADHYAHAEVYCMLAGRAGRYAGGRLHRPRYVRL